MTNQVLALVQDILHSFPLAALMSYGYYTFSHGLRRKTTWKVSALLSEERTASWIPAAFLTASRESFWHRLYSRALVRDLPAQPFAAAVAVRTAALAGELLFLYGMSRWQPGFVAYLLFAASLFFRLRPLRTIPTIGYILFGAGLFLFPIVEPAFFVSGLTPPVLSPVILAPVFFFAAFAEFGTMPLVALSFFLEQSGTLPPGGSTLLIPVILCGGNAALLRAGRLLGPGVVLPERIVAAEFFIFVLFTAGAGRLFSTTSGGEISTGSGGLSGPVLLSLVLAATAAAEFFFIPLLVKKERPRTNPEREPLSRVERADFRLCRKTEYLEAATMLLLMAVTKNFSQLRRLILDVQNASALADEARQVRKTAVREEQTVLETGERIDRALYLLVRHHPDRDADPRQETLQRINRYTTRIAGKIVNLAEYFDRLRRKNAFFTEEESTTVTELLVMVNDLSGYVSDYLSGRVNNLDPGILAGMEQQIEEDASGFRKKALAQLSRARDTGVRKNLAVMETLETIGSMVHDLDRVSSLARQFGSGPRRNL